MATLKDLQGIIPSCTGEKLLCANEIEELMGVKTRKFNFTSKFSSATVANVTEPKGKGQKISEANHLVFISSKKRKSSSNLGRNKKGFFWVFGVN